MGVIHGKDKDIKARSARVWKGLLPSEPFFLRLGLLLPLVQAYVIMNSSEGKGYVSLLVKVYK